MRFWTWQTQQACLLPTKITTHMQVKVDATLTCLIYVTPVLVATALAASPLTRAPVDFVFDDDGAKMNRKPAGRPKEQSFWCCTERSI